MGEELPPSSPRRGNSERLISMASEAEKVRLSTDQIRLGKRRLMDKINPGQTSGGKKNG